MHNVEGAKPNTQYAFLDNDTRLEFKQFLNVMVNFFIYAMVNPVLRFIDLYNLKSTIHNQHPLHSTYSARLNENKDDLPL